MKKNFKKSLVVLAMGTVFLSGCSSMKKENVLTGETSFTESAKWSTLGATSGAAVGGIGGAAGALIGAAVGGAVGGYYGFSLDLAAEELSDEIEQMGVEVYDNDGAIHIIVQDTMLFDVGDHEITKESSDILNHVAKTIGKVEEDFIVKVSGHTDNTGDFKFNVSLSEQRAKAVAQYLYHNNIGAKAIDYRGFADLKPLVENSSEENKARNRRVEIEILPNLVTY